MKCEDCLKVIEEYFDAELGVQETQDVGAHLGRCESCATHLEMLRRERNLYALYRRDLEVTPAIWNQIATRIQAEKIEKQPASVAARLKERLAALVGAPRLSPALTFALVIIAVGATAGLMKYMQPEPQVAVNQPVAQKRPDASVPVKESTERVNTVEDKGREAVNDYAQPDGVKAADEEKRAKLWTAEERADNRRSLSRPELYGDVGEPERLVREAEQKYMAAISLLSRDAKRRRTLLEPDVRARFDQTLAAVDSTIAETRRAARRQPDDPLVVQYMLAAYARKVEVLKEMATYRAEDDDIQ